MTDNLEIQIGRAIHTALKMNRNNPDIIDVSEAIKAAVVLVINMATEDSGMEPTTEGAMAAMAWNIKTMSPEAPARDAKRAEIQGAAPPSQQGAVVSAQPTEKKLLVLPGDPEFNEVKGPKGETISAVEFRKVRGPAKKKAAEVQHWEPSELIEVLNAKFPERVNFEIQGPAGPVPLFALRNTVNQVVEKNVVLTYKHPAASDVTSAENVNTLTARWVFSCFEESFDMDDIMNGPKGIVEQLRGLYRYRGGERIEPNSGPEPPPLNTSFASTAMRQSPMTDHLAESLTPGFRAVQDPYAKRSGDTILTDYKDRMIQSNRSLTPGRR